MATIIASIELPSGFKKEFETYVMSTIFKKVRASVQVIRDEIRGNIQEEVRAALIGIREYRELLGGKLQAELGVPNPQERLITIIDTWLNGIEVKTKVQRDPFLIIDIGILKSSYDDVLSLPAASYTYSSARTEGDIPWLKWLLIEGDKRIIQQYTFKPVRKGSRTGLGIMVGTPQGGWRVPPEYAGTELNNFATRALDKIDSSIDKIVEKVLRRNIE